MSTDSKVRNFGVLLQGMEDGELLEELTRRMHDLSFKMLKQSEAVGSSTGELTLKLKFKADATTVDVRGEITVKEPKMPRGRQMLFFEKDGSLSGKNPKQQSLPLREVPAAKDTKQAPAEQAGTRSV